MKNTSLLLPLIAVCFFIAPFYSGRALAQTIQELNADEFESKMQSFGELQLIDVRTPQEYQNEHIKYAVNLNFGISHFSELLEELDKEKPVFVYGRKGNLSTKAAEQMQAMGFKTIFDLKGGIVAWTSAGKPIELIVAPPLAEQITSADYKKIIGSGDVVLIDFTAGWCIPCKKMEPAIDSLSKEFEGQAVIKKINVVNAKAVTKELGIREIPVVNAYISGKLVSNYIGYQSEERLRTIVKNLLEKSKLEKSKKETP